MSGASGQDPDSDDDFDEPVVGDPDPDDDDRDPFWDGDQGDEDREEVRRILDEFRYQDGTLNRTEMAKAEEVDEREEGRRETLCASDLCPRFAVYGSMYWDNVELRVLDKDEFEAHPFVKARFGFKKRSETSASTLLQRSPGTVHISGLTSAPGGGLYVHTTNADGAAIITANRWRPSKVRVAGHGAALPTEALDHIDWMVPLAFEAELLKDTLAWFYQNPSSYSPIILLLHGQGRIGKDLLLKLFGRVVGEHNMRTVFMSDLAGRFQGFLAKPYLKVPEFTLHGRSGPDTWDKMKAWTGENAAVDLDIKFKPTQFVRINPRFLLTSNDDRCLRSVPEHDARIQAIGCTARAMLLGSAQTFGSPDYFDRIAVLFEDDDFVGRFARYLADRDVSGFKPGRATRTRTREMLLREAMPTAGQAIYDLVAVGGPLFARSLLSSSEVALLTGLDTARNGWTISRGLKQAGWEWLGRAQKLPGRPILYMSPRLSHGQAAAYRAMNLSDLSDEYTAEKNLFDVFKG